MSYYEPRALGLEVMNEEETLQYYLELQGQLVAQDDIPSPIQSSTACSSEFADSPSSQHDGHHDIPPQASIFCSVSSCCRVASTSDVIFMLMRLWVTEGT